MGSDWRYAAPLWLPGGDAQTIISALWGRHLARSRVLWRRERWATTDADFIDADWLGGTPSASVGPTFAGGKTTLVLFHGLEGSSSSHYAQTFALEAQQRHWGFVLPHFRGCSGPINLAPRAYHSGDYEEIGWMLQRVRAQVGPACTLYAVGVSLGGNALLRWVQEAGSTACRTVSAVAAVSAPLDLRAAGDAIDSGRNRWLYAQLFLRTMKHKARSKAQQFPGLFDLPRALAAQTLREFDDAFTAPLHGFDGVEDYWRRASAKPGLAATEMPTLILNARNDPLVPASCLPQLDEAGAAVTLWQPGSGGHVGFPGQISWRSGRPELQLQGLPQAVCNWLMVQGA
ncbi:YheT family hydrolase [Serpentinimonas maccroryi]|uniref:YheT family hydrolase n=1 Tax=Serpentinimonas maccroryi TaxID=1458426 RepID=UPI002033FA67|nr:alpha/beta fold hydrolase [Serpentinimonas maccroryi]MCM2479242.1 alpha/beta fold hydrolase [Serpentinimonas maccroryi]